jgi:hypothetical protein
VTNLPLQTVACRTVTCSARDVPRRVQLVPAGVGLLAVPNLVCARCGATPETVVAWSPVSEGETMPKNTVYGGPSDRNAGPGEPGYIEPRQVKKPAETAEDEAESAPDDLAATVRKTTPTLPKRTTTPRSGARSTSK